MDESSRSDCIEEYYIASMVITNPTGYYTFYDQYGNCLAEHIPIWLPADPDYWQRQTLDCKERINAAKTVLCKYRVSDQVEIADMPDASECGLYLLTKPVMTTWKVRLTSPACGDLWVIVKGFYNAHLESLKGRYVFGAIRWRIEAKEEIEAWLGNLAKLVL